MHVLPPEKDPLSYPRDPSRSVRRDWLIVLATFAALVAIALFTYFLIIPGFQHWGWGYPIGFLVGVALTNLYGRIMDGHWPGERH